MTPQAIKEVLLFVLLFLIIMGSILLSGCSRPFLQDADHEVVMVEWYKNDRSTARAQVECSQYHTAQNPVVGCARAHFDKLADMHRCRIFSPDYNELYSTESDIFLHEMTHCFKGQFHE